MTNYYQVLQQVLIKYLLQATESRFLLFNAMQKKEAKLFACLQASGEWIISGLSVEKLIRTKTRGCNISIEWTYLNDKGVWC